MSKEVLFVVDAVSNEKGVDKEVIFEALEAALASATRKRHGGDVEIRVNINRNTGEYDTFRRWEVVETLENGSLEFPERQITLEAARVDDAKIQLGDFVEEQIDSVEFGRIAAQTAKQVIVQKVREAERKRIADEFRHMEKSLIIGIVKRVERGNVYLDLGNNVEAFIPRDEMIGREAVRTGDRLRAYLKEVRYEMRGPQLFASRTCPEFLLELFKLEVPEIAQGMIDLMGGARDPGSRAKIAVRSNDPRLDPVGACVGMRGSRVQAVSNELAGERIDIIVWDANPAQFVVNAMSPAEVVSIVVDEETHSMDVAVAEERLSQAIGRGGQNIKLASQLTGWQLNIMSEEQAQEKTEQETRKALEVFMNSLDVDEDVAQVLVDEGFTSIEEVAYVPVVEMLEIEGFDEEIVEELRARARDALLTKEIASEEHIGEVEPAEDLLNMTGMSDDIAQALGRSGIATMEDLAELSVDDVVEYTGVSADKAGELILAARAPWFEGQA